MIVQRKGNIYELNYEFTIHTMKCYRRNVRTRAFREKFLFIGKEATGAWRKYTYELLSLRFHLTVLG
jgi:hypothetical protein